MIKQEKLSLYSCDLKKTVPDIETRIPVHIETYNLAIELDNVQFETVEERIARGNLIFAAWYRSKVVGYLFASTQNCEVGEMEDVLNIREGEIYLYDAFTSPGFRGNRIYPALLTTACKYFKERDYAYALIFTRESNVNSVKGIEKAGFFCYQVVQFENKFGEKSWNYSSRSCNVQSHFAHEDK